ncbi:WASH complex subunit 3 isoform X2 [Pelodiscus sinensis]|uniref:WASH complex subunit 3 isoform X2 n=1 Tax=Pelodiscus sinensis TaxID=13735 RepID=UPI003F6D7399
MAVSLLSLPAAGGGGTVAARSSLVKPEPGSGSCAAVFCGRAAVSRPSPVTSRWPRARVSPVGNRRRWRVGRSWNAGASRRRVVVQVPAIQQKRTVAFLNQFVVHTVQFLNRFSTVCEEKLSALSLRIQQIETTLNILDAKLSSIPGLEDVKFEVSSANMNSVTNGPVPQATTDQHSVSVSPQSENSIHERGQQKTEVAAEHVMTVAKDPRYARYLKMVQVGVPVMAIRNKMISEGLDPDLLETPDALVPAWGDEVNGEESSDSESSFSD